MVLRVMIKEGMCRSSFTDAVFVFQIALLASLFHVLRKIFNLRKAEAWSTVVRHAYNLDVFILPKTKSLARDGIFLAIGTLQWK